MSTTTIRPEFRTPAQIAADEEIASSVEPFLVTDVATGWTVIEAADERRRMAEPGRRGANNAIADGGLNVPFLWNGNVYRITKACRRQGTTTVESDPPDDDFRAEVRRRIDTARSHVLTFYQGFGFVCFPEDYARYQG